MPWSQTILRSYSSQDSVNTGIKNRHIDRQNRIESPETNPCIYGQMIYNKGAKNIQWERIVSSINGVGKSGQLHEKESNWITFTPYTTVYSKWVKNLNVRPKTIKLLEENIGRTLYDINHSNILFDPPPREMEIKTKINKWDLMKLQSFCTAKETINKMKRQPSEWDKIFAKRSNWQRINLQNIQVTHAAQYQKNNPIQK